MLAKKNVTLSSSAQLRNCHYYTVARLGHIVRMHRAGGEQVLSMPAPDIVSLDINVACYAGWC